MNANCGHSGNPTVITDGYGYSSCIACRSLDDQIGVMYCARLSAALDGQRVRALSGLLVGTVIERVTNTGARTPTKGKYQSDKLTVRDRLGGTWYANMPKDYRPLILRRAS